MVHAQNFSKYKELFQTHTKFNLAESFAGREISEKLTPDLHNQLKSIGLLAPRIIKAIEESQSMKMAATDILQTANNLFRYLGEAKAEFDENASIDDNLSGLMVRAIEVAMKKLSDYIHDDGHEPKQPAKLALDEMRVFTPSLFHLVEWRYETIESFEGLRAIPALIESLAADEVLALKAEYQKYRELVSQMISKEESPLRFWCKNEHLFPYLAPIVIAYLHVPISGAEVERSFSQMSCILTDKRTSLKVENMSDHLLIAYNYHAKKVLANESIPTNVIDLE